MIQVVGRSSIFVKDFQHLRRIHLETTDTIVWVGMQSAGLQSQVIFRISVVKEDHQSDIVAEVLRRGHVQVPQEDVQVEVLAEDELDELSF